MAKRTATALLLLFIAMPAVVLGGIWFFLLIGTFIVIAAWEYVHMFRAVQMQPSMVITVGGTAILLITRGFFMEWADLTLTILILAALTIHMLAYERGRDQAAIDFAITVGGFVYLGWVGAYLVDLRNLPDGGWWLMLVLPIVWAADTGAYTLGVRYGKHKLAPRLSPKKSWEGYFAGIFTGAMFGAFFTWAYNVDTVLFGHSLLGHLTISIWDGMLLGFVLSTITTLGDLGESLFKRQGGIKDSSKLIPGHGGAFDRIDSWIWAAVIGVTWIRWFFL